MAVNWQKGALFGVGLAMGVGAGALGVMSWLDASGPDAAQASRAMGAAPAASAPAAAASAPRAIASASQCDAAPVLPRKGEEDGRVTLQSKPGGASASEVASLILDGKEAAAAGQQRDAEVTFLNACRNAALLQASEPVPLADAMYQLARHYANAAAFGAQPARELFERADRLYGAALQTYTAKYGPSHEKTRYAQEGLKTVHQVTAGKTPPLPVAKAPASAPAPVQAAPAPAPAPAAVAVAPPPAAPAARTPAPEAAKPASEAAKPAPEAAKPAPEVAKPAPAPAPAKPATAETRTAGTTPKEPASQPAKEPARVAAPEQAPAAASRDAAPAVARRSQPSFDCARARSTTEKLICADEDLARQDRELGRLHQRARQAAADPRAFQRDSDAEWQRREQTCQDRECLQRWYAQRRAELSAAAAPRPAAPAPRRRAAEPEVEAPAAAPAPAPAPVARAPAPRRVTRPEPLESIEPPQAPPVRIQEPAPPVEVAPAPPAPDTSSSGNAPAASGSAFSE